MITFEIPGEFNKTAQQKGVYTRGGKIFFYEKPEVKALRRKFQYHCLLNKPQEPFTGAVHLKVTFYYKARNKKQLGRFKTTAPDIDNLNKLLWDVMQGIFYKNDGQIAMFEARKGYGADTKIKIEIEEIEC